MQLGPDLSLREVHAIHLGMPVDNLSVDQTGDIYAAAFPKILEVVKAFKNPYGKGFPSTIWRIRRVSPGLKYEVKKILEDGEAKIIEGATVVRHDTKTGRLFIGGEEPIEAVAQSGLMPPGVIAQSITVCEPNAAQS